VPIAPIDLVASTETTIPAGGSAVQPMSKLATTAQNVAATGSALCRSFIVDAGDSFGRDQARLRSPMPQ